MLPLEVSTLSEDSDYVNDDAWKVFEVVE